MTDPVTLMLQELQKTRQDMTILALDMAYLANEKSKNWDDYKRKQQKLKESVKRRAAEILEKNATALENFETLLQMVPSLFKLNPKLHQALEIEWASRKKFLHYIKDQADSPDEVVSVPNIPIYDISKF